MPNADPSRTDLLAAVVLAQDRRKRAESDLASAEEQMRVTYGEVTLARGALEEREGIELREVEETLIEVRDA